MKEIRSHQAIAEADREGEDRGSLHLEIDQYRVLAMSTGFQLLRLRYSVGMIL